MGYLAANDIELWALGRCRVKRFDITLELIPGMIKDMGTGLDYRDFSDSIPKDAKVLAYAINTQADSLMFFLESESFEHLTHSVRETWEVPTLMVLFERKLISGERLV